MCSPFLKSFANYSRPLILTIAVVAFGCTREIRSINPIIVPQTVAATERFKRPDGVLRVCADPNNLPFSNRRGEGFENKIADLLAAEMGERVEYTWWAQRRGFFRNTLKSGLCDLVVGVPAGF